MVLALRNIGLALGVRATRFSVRSFGFRRTIAGMNRLPALLSDRRPDAAAVDRWARAIFQVGGSPYGASCLDRSVFLWFLMRQRGIDGRIRIGVAFSGDRIDGHAWVEHNGRVVNDAEDVADHFSVFEQDPAGIVFS